MAERKATARAATRPRALASPRTTRPPSRARAASIFRRLAGAYPDARCELEHETAYQLLAATILSAQCTDSRVNQVTPALFARFPDPAALARADRSEVERLIRPTGFFRNKAKSLIGMASALVERFGGAVPDSMAELVTVPGVGRKTANVILGNAFEVNEGVVVDTHVGRVSRRLGLTGESDPAKVERDLAALFVRRHWTMLAHLLIFHGRRVCVARRPRCGDCVLADRCPSAFTFGTK